MAVATEIITAQDLLDSLGGIPPARVLMRPAPGTATEADLIAINQGKKVICELVDGVLVEKPMGIRESLLAAALIALIQRFADAHKLGFVTGEAGTMRVMPGLVRVPDVAFMAWGRVPGNRVPTQPIPDLSPDLAIEVLSVSNTKAEMERKIGEYFESGTAFVWLVDPKTRTITIHDRDESEARVYGGSDAIVLNKVLPGFRFTLNELFDRLDAQGASNEEHEERPSS
ncbi:MAG: Uma2 family endonuclease [Paludisphaera borealis]|uniref:Uma2 family endonuclease n=1 Tax=Paludisphaera borealis TaxID=1387353 RepID=UPI002840BE91|nr:Uma2 family endonuclease [Paludisphaera borealis]MDR3623286.1 Uma2 family endonuclease [Paludisphaera borealis]